MREAKFTPGPWRQIDMRQDPRTDGIALNAEDSIAIYGALIERQIAKINPENEANAYLIAAAPEMYETLEILLEDCKFPSLTAHGREILIQKVLRQARGGK